MRGYLPVIRKDSVTHNILIMVNVPTRIPDCDCHSPALLDLFLSCDGGVSSAMTFPPLGNSDHVVVSMFPLAFFQTQKGMLLFIAQFMTIFVLNGMVFVII